MSEELRKIAFELGVACGFEKSALEVDHKVDVSPLSIDPKLVNALVGAAGGGGLGYGAGKLLGFDPLAGALTGAGLGGGIGYGYGEDLKNLFKGKPAPAATAAPKAPGAPTMSAAKGTAPESDWTDYIVPGGAAAATAILGAIVTKKNIGKAMKNWKMLKQIKNRMQKEMQIGAEKLTRV